jgi:hypothetical protein
MIAQQIELTSTTIDWHAVRGALNVQRTSSVQPPAPADFLISIYRNSHLRAIPLAALISIRRSPAHSHKASEILAAVGLALPQFSRDDMDESSAPDEAISAIARDEAAESGE